MTVNIETTKISYTHNGSQTVYTYPFWILANDDIKVYVLDSAGAITTLTLNTHYTVTGAGAAAGGTIVLNSASTVATNATITLLSNIEITQPTDYVDGETFSANSLEAVLDKQTRILQQQNEKFDRTFRMPAGSANIAEFPATSKASKVLGFDSAGVPALLALASGFAGAAEALPGTVILRDSAGRAKVAAPSAADDIARKDTMNGQRHDGVSGVLDYAVDTGVVNAYVINLTPDLTAHVAGMPIFVKIANANTGASTIAIDALAAASIIRYDGAALQAGDLKGMVVLTWDGTNYRVLNLPSSLPAEQLIFGSPNSNAVTNWTTGINNITKTGPYFIQGDLTNTPAGSGGYCTHIAHAENTTNATQYFSTQGSSDLWHRTKSGTWGAWNKTATTTGYASSLTANGYIKFPDSFGGWMVQWGTYSGGAQSPTITFPVAFPSACVGVLPHANGVHVNINSLTTTSFQGQQLQFGGGGSTANFTWLAVGY